MPVEQDVVRVRVVNDTLEITIPWDDHETREEVKTRLSGRRWDSNHKAWVVPLSPRNIDTLLAKFNLDESMQRKLQAKRKATSQSRFSTRV